MSDHPDAYADGPRPREDLPAGPEPEGRHHRSVQGGAARAAVFGVSDGLVSNVSLILGIAGASVDPSVVRLAGIAGLVAGAVSMAAGEWVSMQAQKELLEREIDLERREIDRVPQVETVELALRYEARGIPADLARQLAVEIHRDPEHALEVHVREELGVDVGDLGDPIGAAVSSFGAFAVGALVPLVPWFFAAGMAAVVTSLILSALAAAVVGGLLARFTERPPLRSIVRQVGIAGLAAGTTYLIGSVIGVTTT